MSKMSQLHAELSEQANELGFLTFEQALAFGYDVDYETVRLKPVDGREQAHKDYLKRKEEVLADLETLKQDYISYGEQDEIDALTRAINLIKQGEI